MIADPQSPPPQPIEPKPEHLVIGAMPFPMLRGYNLIGVIGRGATGVVYKARQISQDRSVAVKVMLAGVRGSVNAAVELRAEAAKLSALRHPNICPIHEIGIDAGRLFIAQERVERNLAKGQADAIAPPRQAAQWVETLASTIHDIHRQGIVHGNLTLVNVLMSFNGILKITDIGLARFADSLTRPEEEESHGCRAPELADGGRQALNPTVDVFSLGAILFTLLTGRSPTVNPVSALHDPSAIGNHQAREVPRDLATICLRCLQPDPTKRYESAATLADDLTAFLVGRPIQARRPGLVDRAVHFFRRLRGRPSGEGLPAISMNQRRRVDRVQLAFDIACRLMRCTDRNELLRHLAETTAWLTNADSVSVFIIDREAGEFRTQLANNSGVDEVRLPLNAGILGSVAASKQPMNIADKSADPRLGSKTRNLLAVPILDGNGEIHGIVQAANKVGGAFHTEDVEILSNLLTAAAIALERAEKV